MHKVELIKCMKKDALGNKIATVRRFNRFYTKQISDLDKELNRSNFSTAEARVISEIADRESATASELGEELGLDTGYLSRVLQGFESRGLVEKRECPNDARQRLLKLTGEGQKEVIDLNQLTQNQIEQILKDLTDNEQNRLLNAMMTIENILGEKRKTDKISYLLRTPQIGDFGWVVQANCKIFAEEFGWNEKYEALVAQTIANYVKNFDAKKDNCLIAEKDGEKVGAAFLVKKSETMANLLLLFVEPKTRGLGIGKRLVKESIRFAKRANFKKVSIWTANYLVAARHIFEAEGFKLIKTQIVQEFGRELIKETWELKL